MKRYSGKNLTQKPVRTNYCESYMTCLVTTSIQEEERKGREASKRPENSKATDRYPV